MFTARFHPLRAEALNVVFCPLDRADYIQLFHTISVYAHTLCHLPYLVEVHFALRNL
jgi:hypothetical protein